MPLGSWPSRPFQGMKAHVRPGDRWRTPAAWVKRRNPRNEMKRCAMGLWANDMRLVSGAAPRRRLTAMMMMMMMMTSCQS